MREVLVQLISVLLKDYPRVPAQEMNIEYQGNSININSTKYVPIHVTMKDGSPIGF